jgi:hypothetical protein
MAGVTVARPSLPPTNTYGGFAIRVTSTSASPSIIGRPHRLGRALQRVSAMVLSTAAESPRGPSPLATQDDVAAALAGTAHHREPVYRERQKLGRCPRRGGREGQIGEK